MDSIVSNEDLEIIKFLGLDIDKCSNSDKTYNYVSNPDGTVRWIYPSSTSYPCFLNFYATTTVKAKIFSVLIKLTFALKLRDYIKSGMLSLKLRKQSILAEILKNYNWEGYSIFTGTKGVNRKVIVELNRENETFIFVKVALNKNSRELLQNEHIKIKFINQLGLVSVIAPKVNEYNETKGYLALSNIKPKSNEQTTKFTMNHARALSDIFHNTIETYSLNELSFFDRIETCLFKKKEENKRTLKIGNFDYEKMIVGLENIYDNFDMESKYLTSVSHGDFTPWNMFLHKEELLVIDWELSEFRTPIFYDLFHFVFQSSILIERDSYTTIISKINSALQTHPIRDLVNDYNVDINKYYQFYILQVVTYYLDKYRKQDNLHDQVYWLLTVWDEAIVNLTINKGIIFNEE